MRIKMTDEERRAARNAASRKWYQEHRAMNKASAKKTKPAAKAKPSATKTTKSKREAKPVLPEPDEIRDEILETEDDVVVSVDPELLTGIETGDISRDDLSRNDDEDVSDDDLEARYNELKDMDQDEMTQAELDEFEELREEFGEDEYDDYADTMRELEEQGAYDD